MSKTKSQKLRKQVALRTAGKFGMDGKNSHVSAKRIETLIRKRRQVV